MTGFQRRALPLAAPRPVPSLDQRALPRSAVIWHPQLRPDGSLACGVILEIVEGQVVREHLVGPDPAHTPSVTRRANVDPGGNPTISVIDLEQAGRLIRSRSYGNGWALVSCNQGPALASLAVFWQRNRLDTGWTLTLVGSAKAGTDSRLKYADAPRLSIRRVGDASAANWRRGRTGGTLLDGRPLLPPKVGPVVDALTLGGALAGAQFHGPREACRAYGVEISAPSDDPVEALRSEAVALARLWLAVLSEMRHLALPLNPAGVVSPGGLSSVLLTATGMPALAGRFDLPDGLAYAGADAYFGGWHEARAVGVPLPAVLADLSAAYPRSAAALGATRYLTARKIEPQDVSDEMRTLLESPDLFDRALDPAVWRRYGVTLVKVRPRGEVLPFKRDGWLRVACLDLGGDSVWRHWQDIVASTLRSGRAPEIVEAVYLRPVGKVRGLRPVELPSGAVLDLRAGHDLFGQLVSERERIGADVVLDEVTRHRRVALSKSLATSAYGILARIDRQRVSRRSADRALGPSGPITHHNGWTERPGPWCWLPLAGSITASTRLVLAATMVGVNAAGGSVLHLAADSVTIAASHGSEPEMIRCPGGPVKLKRERYVKALPLPVIEGVLGRADALLRPEGGHAWKREVGWDQPARVLISGVNRVYWQAADGSEPKTTEVSLGGQIVDPTGQGVDGEGRWCWSQELHSAYGRHRLAGEEGIGSLAEWASVPALRPGIASDPASLARLQHAFPEALLRPFCSYVTTRDPITKRSALSLESSPTDYFRTAWHDGTGQPVEVARPGAEIDPFADQLRPETVRQVFRRWVGAGRPGCREPGALVSRAALAQLVGKESDFLLAARDDIAGDPERERTVYRSAPDFDAMREACGMAHAGIIADLTGIPARSARRFLAGEGLSSVNLGRLQVAMSAPDWAEKVRPARVHVCAIESRHHWVGSATSCPICPTERAEVFVKAAACAGCGTTFPYTVPDPCPFCPKEVRVA